MIAIVICPRPIGSIPPRAASRVARGEPREPVAWARLPLTHRMEILRIPILAPAEPWSLISVEWTLAALGNQARVSGGRGGLVSGLEPESVVRREHPEIFFLLERLLEDDVTVGNVIRNLRVKLDFWMVSGQHPAETSSSLQPLAPFLRRSPRGGRAIRAAAVSTDKASIAAIAPMTCLFGTCLALAATRRTRHLG